MGRTRIVGSLLVLPQANHALKNYSSALNVKNALTFQLLGSASSIRVMNNCCHIKYILQYVMINDIWFNMEVSVIIRLTMNFWHRKL